MHKTLRYVEYRAVSGVFQNIDPPPLSPPSECVLPPHQRRGIHTRWAVRGVGVNFLEYARRRTGLLQYNLSANEWVGAGGQFPSFSAAAFHHNIFGFDLRHNHK
jgi:hypothetical protein